jgi:hypothetical protein
MESNLWYKEDYPSDIKIPLNKVSNKLVKNKIINFKYVDMNKFISSKLYAGYINGINNPPHDMFKWYSGNKTTINQLPCEVLNEILEKIPIRKLLSAASVSKKWCQLINIKRERWSKTKDYERYIMSQSGGSPNCNFKTFSETVSLEELSSIYKYICI